jgi:hypothetical protein
MAATLVDAGTESANLCAACGGHIRFCYILKVLASGDVSWSIRSGQKH